MLQLSRECVTHYQGHEIVLYAAYNDIYISSMELKLTIDHQVIDKAAVVFPSTGPVTLRGLVRYAGRSVPVEAVFTKNMLTRDRYEIYVADRLVLSERGGVFRA
jgi:hypothetical protein